MTVSQILIAVAEAQFRPFDDRDWDAFAGCTSDNPLLGETNIAGRNYVIVVDGSTVSAINSESETINEEGFQLITSLNLS